jgi:hypothetical protein
MKLTYRFNYYKNFDRLYNLCVISKNLYNQGNYIVIQELEKNKKWIHYYDLQKILSKTKNLEDEINYKLLRAQNHDASKLEEPELSAFTIHTENLAGCTYGSHQYDKFLEALKPALDHHYANNSHHPEHYKNGLEDMTLVDLIEMFVDWKAATLRHNDGNLRKSIEHNSKRFNMNPQLTKIFENTAALIEQKE